MHLSRRIYLVLLAALALLAVTATPSLAVVGGTNAAPGEYPSIARVTFGKGFLCTGTLIAPNYVLTAGHCGSVTGAVASPAAWPAALVDVRVGGTKPSDGELVPVKRVVVQPKYFVNKGYDIALIELQRTSVKAPVQVSGSSETSLWSAGTMETIVGWGATEEDGSSATTLQKAQVPVTTDSYCQGAYSEFDPVSMLCAGYPEGGIDTCQGDSGGPMYGRTSTGALRVVGATSFGEGCARPGKPGVYARVGDSTLREWIRGIAPAGVAG